MSLGTISTSCHLLYIYLTISTPIFSSLSPIRYGGYLSEVSDTQTCSTWKTLAYLSEHLRTELTFITGLYKNIIWAHFSDPLVVLAVFSDSPALCYTSACVFIIFLNEAFTLQKSKYCKSKDEDNV